MNAAQRRERILTRLNSAGAPLSASILAAELGVSRQIVVGDVALLRAGGAQIDATPRGYQLHPAEKGYTGILACVHRTPEALLSRMTGGVHLHTLRCPDKDTFARIRAALEQQGLLYRKE